MKLNKNKINKILNNNYKLPLILKINKNNQNSSKHINNNLILNFKNFKMKNYNYKVLLENYRMKMLI